MESLIGDVKEVLMGMDVFEYFAWGGLLYVIYKQIVTENRVTFEANNPVREHRERVMTGIFYVPFVSIACFHVITVMRLFVMIMIFQGMGEYIQIVFLDRKYKKNPRPYQFTLMDRVVQFLSLAPSVGFFYSHLFATTLLYNVFFLIIVVYLIFLICTPSQKMEMREFYRIALYWFGIMWISWPLSHAVIVLVSLKIDGVPYGSALLCIVLLASWASDVAGFYVGKKFGYTKVMPHISPNKSLEGFFAQFSSGVGFCIICKLFESSGFVSGLPPISWFNYIFIGACISVFGAFGDILESFIKRMGGVKDSGIFFPGHGGILDRFDAFLLACPVTFYYILYFVTDGPDSLYS